MRESTRQEKQQYQRLREIFDTARQRYLAAGGDPHRAADNRYLTEAEKREAFDIGEQIFGIEVKDGYVHCQGRSWKLTQKQEVEHQDSI